MGIGAGLIMQGEKILIKAIQDRFRGSGIKDQASVIANESGPRQGSGSRGVWGNFRQAAMTLSSTVGMAMGVEGW